jgi:hypothetical protein
MSDLASKLTDASPSTKIRRQNMLQVLTKF